MLENLVALSCLVIVACGDDRRALDAAAADLADSAAADVPETVASGCSSDDLDACDYPSLGLAVTVRDGVSITDTRTGRVLPLLARIPAGAGPFPVVVWSHGGSFNAVGHRLSAKWGDLFASHGYVVIHIGHSPPDGDIGATVCALASIPSDECVGQNDDDESGLLAVFRAFDVLAVVERLGALSAQSVDGGGPALDIERVAVAGWSGGSRGPLMMGGMTVAPSASAPLFSMPDDRVDAIIALSPAGPGFGGMFDDGDGTSWDELRGPTLMATGANDVKPNKTDLTGPIRRFPFGAQPADGTRWLLYSNLPIGVGGHGTYNYEDADASDERLARLSRALGSAARAFLDAHLGDDADAAAWLARDDARILAGDVDWQRR